MKYYVLLIINDHFQMIYLDWLLDNLVQNLSHIHSDVGIVNSIGSFWRSKYIHMTLQLFLCAVGVKFWIIWSAKLYTFCKN